MTRVWPVGDTGMVVDYWPPNEPTRVDDVADMLTALRNRIAALREDIMAKKDPDEGRWRNAPEGRQLIEALTEAVYKNDPNRPDDETYEDWKDKHVI